MDRTFWLLWIPAPILEKLLPALPCYFNGNC